MAYVLCFVQGSTVQREASDKEKAKDLPTFKDNDFINERMRIQIGDENKERLMANIQADVQVTTTTPKIQLLPLPPPLSLLLQTHVLAV